MIVVEAGMLKRPGISVADTIITASAWSIGAVGGNIFFQSKNPEAIPRAEA